MKQLFVFILGFIVVMSLPQSLSAQDAVVDLGNEGGNAILVATVNFESGSLVQDGDTISLSFNLSNRSGVQPDVRYGVVLTRADGDRTNVYDQKTWDEVLTLREGETVSRTISYTLPPLTEGTYDVFVVSENTQGLRFGVLSAGQITVGGSNRGFVLDPGSCYLTTGSGENTKKLTPGESIPQELTDTILGHCTVTNLGERSEEVVPSVVLHERSTFGVIAAEQKAESALRTISGGESALISVPLPGVSKPQAYVARVSFGELSSEYTFEFVVAGKSATVQSVLFDKDSYMSGEQAEITFFWSGAADSETTLTNPVVQAEVKSGETSCGVSHMKPLETNAVPRITFTLPIDVDCKDPTLEVTIIDAEAGIIATASFLAHSLTQDDEEQTGFTPENRSISVPVSVLAAILALILLLVYAAVQFRRNPQKDNDRIVNSPNIPPTVGPSVFFLLLLGGVIASAPQVYADTFYVSSPTEVYEVAVNIDKTMYSPNEAINIAGSISIATCACSGSSTAFFLQYNIDPFTPPYTGATTFLFMPDLYGGSHPFTASASAPETTGPHRIFIIAGTNEEFAWIFLPFSVSTACAECPTPASCDGQTTLGCQIPLLDDGAPGGSCQSGYYGTCSYTCIAGIHTENYNTCAFVRPDLSSPDIMPADGTSASPSSGAEYTTIDTITFSGFAVNSNAKWIRQAGWAELEIENVGTGVVTTVNAYGGFELGSFVRNQIKDLTYSTTLPAGNYRYRFVVDTDNEVEESNESNNTSSWFEFTVVDAGIPCAAMTVDIETVQDCDLPLTAEGQAAGSCAIGYTGACSYSCAAGDWTRITNTCAREYDLATVSISPTEGQVFNMGDNFDITTQVINNSVHVIDGDVSWFTVYLELERVSPNPQTWLGEFFTYTFGLPEFYVLESGWAVDKTIPMTIPGSFDGVTYFNEAGNYRYRLNAELGVDLPGYSESDYDNNVTPWVYFTVAEESACPDTVINGCDVPVNPSANNGCVMGYVGSCDYTCDVGTGSWVEVTNTCTPPVINVFEVCDADGVSNCTNGTKSVNPGEVLVINWDATASMCVNLGAPTDFITDSEVSGSDFVTANVVPLQSDTYTLSCTYDDNTWVEDTVTVNTTGVSPVLQSSASIVNVGDDVTLTWDTNNSAAGGESVCTLTGGGIDSNILQLNGGDPELGSAVVEIKGRSTFVLRCDPNLDAAIVEIFPIGLEG